MAPLRTIEYKYISAYHHLSTINTYQQHQVCWKKKAASSKPLKVIYPTAPNTFWDCIWRWFLGSVYTFSEAIFSSTRDIFRSFPHSLLDSFLNPQCMKASIIPYHQPCQGWIAATAQLPLHPVQRPARERVRDVSAKCMALLLATLVPVVVGEVALRRSSSIPSPYTMCI